MKNTQFRFKEDTEGCWLEYRYRENSKSTWSKWSIVELDDRDNLIWIVERLNRND